MNWWVIFKLEWLWHPFLTLQLKIENNFKDKHTFPNVHHAKHFLVKLTIYFIINSKWYYYQNKHGFYITSQINNVSSCWIFPNEYIKIGLSKYSIAHSSTTAHEKNSLIFVIIYISFENFVLIICEAKEKMKYWHCDQFERYHS